MKAPGLHRLVMWVVRIGVGFYFRRIERFHPEHIPATGPLMLTCNHPNSLTDSFVVAVAVPRKVNFVGTVQLFQFRPLKWLLENCGVIPINRLKDDPRGMRTVADTFEACYRVLERGEAIGIFPEGITHDDPQLKTVKTGAARMALELEHRHAGRLGLKIVPAGLTLSAKDKYRSEVLVNFGEAISAADFLQGYPERKKECIVALNGEIERRLQSLILHIPKLEQARLVEAVKRLYLSRPRVGDQEAFEPAATQAEALRLSQTIVAMIERIEKENPERVAVFTRKLDHYEEMLRRFQLSDESLMKTPRKRRLAKLGLGWTAMAIFGSPLALYGWIHRLPPFLVVHWAVNRFANVGRHKAQTSTAAIVAGLVSFGSWYLACALVCRHFLGWKVALWYGISLPVAGMIAHYYVRRLRQLSGRVRDTFVLLRSPAEARRLREVRGDLIGEIESVR